MDMPLKQHNLKEICQQSSISTNGGQMSTFQLRSHDGTSCEPKVFTQYPTLVYASFLNFSPKDSTYKFIDVPCGIVPKNWVCSCCMDPVGPIVPVWCFHCDLPLCHKCGELGQHRNLDVICNYGRKLGIRGRRFRELGNVYLDIAVTRFLLLDAASEPFKHEVTKLVSDPGHEEILSEAMIPECKLTQKALPYAFSMAQNTPCVRRAISVLVSFGNQIESRPDVSVFHPVLSTKHNYKNSTVKDTNECTELVTFDLRSLALQLNGNNIVNKCTDLVTYNPSVGMNVGASTSMRNGSAGAGIAALQIQAAIAAAEADLERMNRRRLKPNLLKEAFLRQEAKAAENHLAICNTNSQNSIPSNAALKPFSQDEVTGCPAEEEGIPEMATNQNDPAIQTIPIHKPKQNSNQWKRRYQYAPVPFRKMRYRHNGVDSPYIGTIHPCMILGRPEIPTCRQVIDCSSYVKSIQNDEKATADGETTVDALSTSSLGHGSPLEHCCVPNENRIMFCMPSQNRRPMYSSLKYLCGNPPPSHDFNQFQHNSKIQFLENSGTRNTFSFI